MTTALAHKVVSEAIRRAIPSGTMSVSAWAEANRYVDRGANKGRWSNRTVPFAVEIMDAFSDPDVREVVFQKSAQVGGSEILANVVGYYIEVDPTDIAYVAEKEDKTRAWMIESFDSMVRVTPSLKSLVKTADEDNNQRVKRFPGGQFFGFWATSPSELSSRPIRVLLCDEKAAYKNTSEGDAVKLGEARTKTYDGFEKIGKVSTPRQADDPSDIEADFLRGDKCQYWVPCPSCDTFQLLQWANVHWDDDPDLAVMACPHCGVVLEYDDLQEMLERGRWVKDADLDQPFWPEHPADPQVRSFKINQLYSPFVHWRRMVKDFLEARSHGPGSPQMQVWVNTALGEPWRPYEKIDYGDLTLNREDYAAEVPSGVLLLTAGVDVQGDRLEYEIVGWGRDNESWSIRIGVIDGDPGQLAVWDELTAVLTAVYTGETGEHRVACAFIDSGYHAQMVYRFVKMNAARHWFACKGMPDPHKPITGKATWVECRLPGHGGRVRMFPVGTTAAKDEIFSHLRITEHGPGYCHFPRRPEYDEAYLKQLCSERKVTKFRNGNNVSVYEKVSAGARNEALDLRVYATAARVKLNPNFDRIARRRLQHASVADREPEPPVSPGGQPDDTPPPPPATTPEARRKKFKVVNNPFAGYKP